MFSEFNVSYIGNIVTGGIIAYLLFSKIGDVSVAYAHFENIIIFTVVVNILIVIAEFISPDFRIIKESFIFNYGDNIDYTENIFKYRGLAGGAGSTLSILYALAFIYFERQRHHIFLTLIFFILILFGLFTSGRSGIIFLILFYMLWFMTKSYIHFFTCCLWAAVALLGYSILISSFEVPSKFQYALLLIGSFSEFYYAIHLDELLIEYRQAFKSDDILTLLFGAGSFTGGMEVPYQGDSTFSRVISSYGFLGYSVYLLFTLYLIYVFRFDKTFKIILIVSFVLSFKEVILFEGYFSRIFWTIVFLKGYIRTSQKREFV
jgi:hypothetical protein